MRTRSSSASSRNPKRWLRLRRLNARIEWLQKSRADSRFRLSKPRQKKLVKYRPLRRPKLQKMQRKRQKKKRRRHVSKQLKICKPR